MENEKLQTVHSVWLNVNSFGKAMKSG